MVVIGHPGRQHSHRLAAALAEAGILSVYCSGQFDATQLERVPRYLRWAIPPALGRHPVPHLSNATNTTRPYGLAITHLARKLPGRQIAEAGELAGNKLFDHQLARLVSRYRPLAVVGYEVACLETFRVSRAVGATCVLDAAACHHRLQDLRLGIRPELLTRLDVAVRVRKDAEVAMADLVICASELSARSYLEAGVPAEKIVVNTLGVDAGAFAAGAVQQRTGPIRFAFVANSAVVKGGQLVDAAIRSLKARGGSARFDLVGDAASGAASGGGVEVARHGQISQREVARVLRDVDCVVLPSRLESFGMVVLEALASGAAVIVSDWVGAASLVRQDVNGWQFGDSQEAFIARVIWCCENADYVRAMRPACVASVSEHGWDAYGRRAIAIMRRLLADRLV